MRLTTYKTRYTGTYIYVPVPGTILSSHAKFIIIIYKLQKKEVQKVKTSQKTI